MEGFFNSISNFFSTNGWNIVKFFAVLFLGIAGIKLLLNVSKKVLFKTNIEKITISFALGIIKFLLYLFLTLILLNIVGIQVTGILTAFSAVLLAIGVALENNISNFANGLIIVTTKMFNKGDYIAIYDDVEGTITNINFLFTTLVTTDNKRITLPNSKIVNNSVTNNGAFDTRRINLTFSVAYESDVELVKKIVTDVMKSNGKVYLDKPIFCRLKTMSASSLDFYSYCWVDNGDYWDVYYYLMETVYNEFKRNNITVPFNQLEVTNKVAPTTMPIIGDAMPVRVEKQRNGRRSFDLENSDLTKLFHFDRKKRKKKKKKSNPNNQNQNSTNSPSNNQPANSTSANSNNNSNNQHKNSNNANGNNYHNNKPYNGNNKTTDNKSNENNKSVDSKSKINDNKLNNVESINSSEPSDNSLKFSKIGSDTNNQSNHPTKNETKSQNTDSSNS